MFFLNTIQPLKSRFPNYRHPFNCDVTLQYTAVGHVRIYTAITQDFLAGIWSENVIITHLFRMHLVLPNGDFI